MVVYIHVGNCILIRTHACNAHMSEYIFCTYAITIVLNRYTYMYILNFTCRLRALSLNFCTYTQQQQLPHRLWYYKTHKTNYSAASLCKCAVVLWIDIVVASSSSSYSSLHIYLYIYIYSSKPCGDDTRCIYVVGAAAERRWRGRKMKYADA